MLRVALTIVLPLLLPTAIYVAWIELTRRQSAREPVHWAALPWLWLGAAGVLLLGTVLAVITVHFGEPQTGVYVPPRYEGGHVVPGHLEPRRGQ